MNTKYILIILGEPYSTFSEIIGKYFVKKKILKKKIILIGCKSLLQKQLIKLDYFFNLNEIHKIEEAKSNIVNIIDVKYNYKNIYDTISVKSNGYIKNSFDISLKILKKNFNQCVLINGPISKKTFLRKKYLGITEYLARKTQIKDEVMLIYNKKLSVSPITTHIPVKYVTKKISKDKIKKHIIRIDNFFKKILKKKIKIAVLGLNPHCETIDKFSEEESIIKPSIKYLKAKKINVSGPYSADTFFLKNNIEKFDVVVGMYHDQVLTPIKTLFKFEAINLTIGLPFIRISPDHGPNSIMLGKNKSDPASFLYAMKFIENIK